MTISNNVGAYFDKYNMMRTTQNGCSHVVQRVGKNRYRLLAVVMGEGLACQLADDAVSDGLQVLVFRRQVNSLYRLNETVNVADIDTLFDTTYGRICTCNTIPSCDCDQ